VIYFSEKFSYMKRHTEVFMTRVWNAYCIPLSDHNDHGPLVERESY